MESTKRLQEIMAKHLTNLTSQHSNNRSLAEMAVDDFNNLPGEMKGYDCPLCKNKGQVAFLQDGEDRYRQCECLEIRRANKRQAASGIEMLLNRFRFDNYNIAEDWQRYTLNKAKDYAEQKEGWFFIGGKSGTGKTHICTAIVGQLLQEGFACKYMLWRDEARELKAKANTDEYAPLIKPLKETKCLYIDDFLKGGITTGDINLAFEILNHRWMNGLPTIISSELLIKDILNVDEAIGGRIYQTARQNLIQIQNGANYRLKG